MPFSFVSSAPAYASSTSSAVPSKPTSTAKNDIMFALLSREDQSGEPNSVPSGWTRIEYNQSMINNFSYAGLYYKIAGPSEPSSYTWGWSASTGTRVEIATYRGGFDIDDPIDASDIYTYITNNVLVTTGSIAVANDNSPLLAIGAVYRTSGVTFTAESGFTKDVDDGDSSSDFWNFFTHSIVASTGGTGSIYTDASISLAEKNAFIVSLNPSGDDTPSLELGGGF